MRFKLFTEAIDQAESEQGGGKLALTVERPADTNAPTEQIGDDKSAISNPKSQISNLKSLQITLQLTVLGT